MFVFALILLCNSGITEADHLSFNHSYLSNYPGVWNESSQWVAPYPLKFQQWYPELEAVYQYTSEITCNVTRQGYLGSEEARSQLGPVGSYCDTHMACMLGSMPENIKSNQAASTIVLGLTPSILASLGPTVAEISLLSLRRPLLALLVSLGSPAIYPTRLVTYDNPFDVLKPNAGALAVPRIKKYMWTISAVQYLLASGAAVNVLWTSYQLGTRGVLLWACSTSYLPLVWSLTTVVIHVVAICALRISLHRPKSPCSGQTQMESFKLASMIQHEFQLSANGGGQRDFQGIQVGPVGVALNFLATCMGYFHVIFGTIIFSAHSLVGLTDATRVFFFYVLSALVCRVIIYFETAGMRRVDESQTYMWIVQEKSRSD